MFLSERKFPNIQSCSWSNGLIWNCITTKCVRYRHRFQYYKQTMYGLLKKRSSFKTWKLTAHEGILYECDQWQYKATWLAIIRYTKRLSLKFGKYILKRNCKVLPLISVSASVHSDLSKLWPTLWVMRWKHSFYVNLNMWMNCYFMLCNNTIDFYFVMII